MMLLNCPYSYSGSVTVLSHSCNCGHTIFKNDLYREDPTFTHHMIRRHIRSIHRLANLFNGCPQFT